MFWEFRLNEEQWIHQVWLTMIKTDSSKYLPFLMEMIVNQLTSLK